MKEKTAFFSCGPRDYLIIRNLLEGVGVPCVYAGRDADEDEETPYISYGPWLYYGMYNIDRFIEEWKQEKVKRMHKQIKMVAKWPRWLKEAALKP